MTINKLLLAVGAAGLIGAATPANATFCWFGKCGGTSSGGSSSSGGTPTPVPEPEQMTLFAMGSAVLGLRMFAARRKRK